jgi:hypothetical protein
MDYTLKIGDALSYPLSADYSDKTLPVTTCAGARTIHNDLGRFFKISPENLKDLWITLQFEEKLNVL